MNINTKKKSCKGCKVDRKGIKDELPKECELGYRIKWVGSIEPYRHESIPYERCPKPLTISDYLEASKWYRKFKIRK